jgi:cell division septal protein FtsQ
MSVGTIEKRRRRAGAASPPAAPVSASRGWIWAVVQLAVLGAEIFVTLFVLAQPAFRPKQLDVTGIRHLSLSEVRIALQLPPDRTIFFLSRQALEQRLQALPWVRSATVDFSLPDQVSIKVIEWKPSAVLQVGESSYYLNAQGTVLDPATEPGALTIVNRPEFGSVKSGQPALSGDLLPLLLQLQARFAPAFKVSIMSFTVDNREVLSAQTDRGWTIIFGQMLTSDDRATLEPKLAALHALSSRLDLTSRRIAYINLENPGAPAVEMRH